MQMKIWVPLVFLAACALVDQIEALYINATKHTCETCNVVNCYGHVIHNECCFYFAEKSTCEGCCKTGMELDPVTFLPKQVNQSCCAPVYKKAMTSILWCHCGQDCAGKLTDDKYPGWSFEKDFRYDVVSQCSCIGNSWQTNVAYDRYQAIYPDETPKPEEHLLKEAMEETNVAYPGSISSPAETPKPEEHLLKEAMEEVIARKNGYYEPTTTPWPYMTD